MRMSNFMTVNVVRKVMPAEGIENTLGGWRASQGALLGVDMHSVQHDPEIYPDPDTYDPFRFSRPRESPDTSSVHKKVNGTGSGTTGLVTTSDIFLPFSHGRHACPGRFFVALEMKLILAYIVMNYEIEPLKTRPANTWFGQNAVPSMKATIKVRRKEGTTGD